MVLNVTAVNPAAAGYLTAYPTGASVPTASNLNFAAGEVVPNLVEVGTGTNGRVSFFASSQSDIVVDVEGYVSAHGRRWAPARALQPASGARSASAIPEAGNGSALSGGNAQCDGPGNNGERLGARELHRRSRWPASNGVPELTSRPPSLNVTVANPSEAGYLTVFPEGGGAIHGRERELRHGPGHR